MADTKPTGDKQKPPTKAQPIPQRKRLAMPPKQPKPK